jgi:hypothetical protein
LKVNDQDFTQIDNLCRDTLYRIHKFTRLANKLDWSYKDLDWVLESLKVQLGEKEITKETLKKIAAIKELRKRFDEPLDVLCSLWYDIKTIGEGDKSSFQSLFDRTFNYPVVFDDDMGKKIYHPKYINNSLYMDEVISCNIPQKTQRDVHVIKKLKDFLGLTDNDLGLIINAYFSGKTTILLDIPTLSCFYRIAQIARLMGISVKEYFIVARLCLSRTTINSPEEVLQIAEYVDWIRESGCSINKLQYLISGTLEDSIDKGYKDDELSVFYTQTLPPLLNKYALKEDSFINEIIDQKESALIWNKLVKKMIITADGILTDTGLKIDGTTNLDFLSMEDPKLSQEIIPLVRSTLIKTSGNVLNCCIEAFSKLFKVPGEMMKSIFDGIMIFARNNQFADILKPHVYIAKAVLLSKLFNLNEVEILNIAQCWGYFGIPYRKRLDNLSVSDLRNIYFFKQLAKEFQDNDNQLLAFFQKKDTTLLQKLTFWNTPDLVSLKKELGYDILFTNQIYRLKQCFDMAGHLGCSISYLISLKNISEYNLNYSRDCWQPYNDMAESTLNILKSKEDWDKTYEEIIISMSELKRDALINYVICKLRAKGIVIETKDDLFDYFLIDPEMSGKITASRIQQAIGSAQLYIQRCRMNLEKGVSCNEMDEWHDWMSSYRVWEANRKVFLYPENYFDPTLRKIKTPFYKELEDELLQGNITFESVANAYKNYMDKFMEVSKLKIVDSYYHTYEGENFIYLFARTSTMPSTYYYCKGAVYYSDEPGSDGRRENIIWGNWEKINAVINSEYVTPAFAFDKLFIFWVEQSTTYSNDLVDGKSNEFSKAKITKATIKYTFHNFSNTWVQPQVLKQDMVINYEQSNYFIKGDNVKQPNDVAKYLGAYGISLNPEAICWKKVYALNCLDANTDKDRLVILYGDMAYQVGDVPAVTTDYNKVTAKNETEKVFNNLINLFIKRGKQEECFYSFIPALVLDDILDCESLNVVIEKERINYLNEDNEDNETNVTTANQKSSLYVMQTKNVLANNYVESSELYYPEQMKENLICNINRQAKSLKVKNVPGHFIFDNGDERYLAFSQEQVTQDISHMVNAAEDEITQQVSIRCINSWRSFENLRINQAFPVCNINGQATFSIFAVGEDKKLWYITRDNGVWGNWYSPDMEGKSLNSIVVTMGPSDNQDFTVSAVGEDNKGWFKSDILEVQLDLNPWLCYSGSCQFKKIYEYTFEDTTLEHEFAIGLDNKFHYLKYLFKNDGTYTIDWPSLTGEITKISAVEINTNNMNYSFEFSTVTVLGLGVDGYIAKTELSKENHNFKEWIKDKSVQVKDMAAIKQLDERVAIFAIKQKENTLCKMVLNGPFNVANTAKKIYELSKWEDFGDKKELKKIYATTNEAGYVVVFAIGQDNKLWSMVSQGVNASPGLWVRYTNIDNVKDISIVKNENNKIEVFIVDNDNKL